MWPGKAMEGIGGCPVATVPMWSRLLEGVEEVGDRGQLGPVLSGNGRVVVGIEWLVSPSL